MPVAMIATEAVWIVRLKMLRGRHEAPVGQEIEDKADHHESADHAEQTCVDFQGGEEISRLRRRARSRWAYRSWPSSG
jgi:hypothetical protein